MLNIQFLHYAFFYFRRKKDSSSEEANYSESESEWDTGTPKESARTSRRRPTKAAARKTKSKAKTSKRKKKTADWDDESESDYMDDYQRHSSRKLGSSREKPSYVVPDTDEDVDEDTVQSWTVEGEDEAAEDVPTVDKVLDQRQGRRTATGPATTVYSVKQVGDPNAGGEEDSDREQQYLIKWKGYSHLHNTWESDGSLERMSAKGMKKVDNYMKKQLDIARWKKHSNPEDVEYMECQMEMENDMLSSYTKVERIVDRTPGLDGAEYPDYYVKWRNLPYSEATWESGKLIEEENQEQIRQYRIREESRYTPSKSNRVLKHRPKFVQE